MKQNIVHKLCLKYKQDGVVLLFTIFLLLIITILTIAFLYLQFLEADLIAYETENLQAFYLANAGLVHGIKEFKERPGYIKKRLEESPTHTFVDSNSETRIDFASNKQGTFYSKYTKDTVQSNNKYSITIIGIGMVDDKTQTKRELEKRANLLSSRLPDYGDLPGDNDFVDLIKELDYSVVTSINSPNLQGEHLQINVELEDQTEILTQGPDNPQISGFKRVALNEEQNDAIDNFGGKNKIAIARRIDKNNNELLFFGNNECNYINYNSIYLAQILPSALGDQCPFKYTEYRSKLGSRTIIKPSMILKQNKKIVLKEGLYFFESLTLEEGSIISTEGKVLIYVTALELKKEAQLMGGSINSPNPNHLIVLAEYWDGYPYNSSINMVKIGPGARVYAHIFAPNLKVILARGSRKNTHVYGSILTKQLVTYKDNESYMANIQITYGEYLPEEVEEVIGSWREVRNP